jgi:hypothetical protein
MIHGYRPAISKMNGKGLKGPRCVQAAQLFNSHESNYIAGRAVTQEVSFLVIVQTMTTPACAPEIWAEKWRAKT